jgi:hypothetical protein
LLSHLLPPYDGGRQGWGWTSWTLSPPHLNPPPPWGEEFIFGSIGVLRTGIPVPESIVNFQLYCKPFRKTGKKKISDGDEGSGVQRDAAECLAFANDFDNHLVPVGLGSFNLQHRNFDTIPIIISLFLS